MADDMLSDFSEDADRALSRRRMLMRAGMAVGAAWIAPTVLALDVTPAAASPAGCTDCGQNVIPLGDGDGTSTTNWTSISNVQATGGVFNSTSNAAYGNAEYTRDFSAARTNRFGTQTPVNATLAATLAAGWFGPTTVMVRFYDTLGGTGTQLGSDLVISTAAPTSPQTATIPTGTKSFRVFMSLGYRNNGGQQPGTADDITLTLGTC